MKRTGVFTALAWVFGTLGAIALLGADAWAGERTDYSDDISDQTLTATDYSYSLSIGTISNIASTTGTGGAVTATASNNTLTNSKVTLNLTDGTFTGNSITLTTTGAARGGAAYIDLSDSSNTLTDSTVIINLSDTTFTGNHADGTTDPATAQGGAIWIAGAETTITNAGGASTTTTTPATTLTLTNVDFSGNYATAITDDTTTATGTTATAQGGAIYATNLASFAITGGTFTGNHADGTTTDLTSTTATGTAQGGAIWTNSDLTISDGTTFTNNSATGTTAQGGAIWIADTTTTPATTLTLTNVDFSGNYATAITDDTTTATGTTATAQGGAIYATNLASFAITGGTFTGNHADGTTTDLTSTTATGTAQGGAIWTNSDLTISDGTTFTNNSATGTTAQGGAIWIADTTTTPATTLTLTNVDFSGNYATAITDDTTTATGTTATAQGGAIYATNLASFAITGGTFTGNHADGTTTDLTSTTATGTAQGGAIWTNSDLTISDGTTFTNNSATGTTAQGGAIWIADTTTTPATTLTLTNVDFSGNYATAITDDTTTATGTTATAQGGAIYATNLASFAITGGTFTGNHADGTTTDLTSTTATGTAQGGAIWTNSDLTISDGTTFTNNSATGTTAQGGAIWIADTTTTPATTLTLTNVDFSGNYATAITDDTTTATGTTATAQGGAIYATNLASFAITGGTFTGNHADGTTTDLTSTTATGTAQGGAIWTNSDLTISDGTTFTNNSATGTTAQGGAIWIDSALAITDTTFTDNYASATTTATGTTATAQGGAIYASGGALTLTGVTFEGNYTSDDGGTTHSRNAIYLADNASVTFADYKDGNGNITPATSYDYDGIAGSGTVTMASTGELHLYGDYSNLTGTIKLAAGTTYFDNRTTTTTTAAGTTTTLGGLIIGSGATLDMSGRDAGNTLAVGTLIITAGSTLAVTLGDANNTLNSTSVPVIQASSVTVGSGSSAVGKELFTLDAQIADTIREGNTYQVVASDNTIANGAGASWAYEKLMYTATVNVNRNDITLTTTDVTSVSSVANTSNQNRLGSYLDTLGAGSNLYNYIYNNAESYDAVRRALNLSTGDIYASGMAAIAQWDRRGNDMLIDRMNTVFMSDSPLCSAPSVGSGSAYGSSGYTSANVSGIWAQVEGYHYKSDSTANAGQAKSKGWGLALGYDKLIADWVFGIAFRYGDSRLDVHERNARVDTDSYSLGLYGGKRVCVGPGVLHVIGGMTGGYHDNDSRRSQQLGASSYSYTADYDSTTLSAYLDTGVTFGDTSRFAFQPFANVMWSGIWNDSVTEKGSGDRLHVGSDDHDWWSTSLGIRAMGRVYNNLAFDVNAAWRHTYGTLSASTQNRFVNSVTGDRFTVHGTPLERNEGVIGAGLTCNITENVFVRASYDYSFGSGKAQSHEGFLNVGVAF